MAEKYYDPLSDMSRTKESLRSLFLNTEDITKLICNCFDTPHIVDTVPDNGSAIYIETYLKKLDNQHIKEVGVDVTIVCHQDSVQLSEEETEYYHSIGIYGNRIDSAIQAVNAAIMRSPQNYFIGSLTLANENPVKQYVPGTGLYGKSLSYTYPSFYQRKKYMR